MASMSDKRALTTRQPWASLIMAGVKDVENRSWPVPSTMPQWMTCLGCYAEADPDDVAENPECPRPCACDNGYTVEPGAGILDSRHVRNWVPSSEVGSPSHVGPFPFRLWIHAGAAWDSAGTQAAYEAELICDEPDPQTGLRPNGQPALWRGVLLGSVLVTGCHWSDECRETKSAYWPGRGERWESFCSEWAEPDAYHWTLADPQPLPEPIPMRGHQRLWTLPVRRGW